MFQRAGWWVAGGQSSLPFFVLTTIARHNCGESEINSLTEIQECATALPVMFSNELSVAFRAEPICVALEDLFYNATFEIWRGTTSHGQRQY